MGRLANHRKVIRASLQTHISRKTIEPVGKILAGDIAQSGDHVKSGSSIVAVEAGSYVVVEVGIVGSSSLIQASVQEGKFGLTKADARGIHVSHQAGGYRSGHASSSDSVVIIAPVRV